MKIKKILVSQPKPTTEKSPYFDLAEEFGLKLEFKSFIKVEGVTAKEFRQERINILDFTGIVFTSRTAIDHFFRICTEMRVTVPDTMKYFCISEAIAFYLQKYIVYRKRKIFYGDKKVEDMTKILLKHKTENFLVPVSDVHKENIPALMNVPTDKVQEIVTVLPGVKSPTIMPLATEGWSSIHTVLDQKCFWEIIGKLKAIGAQGILVLPIEKMIL